MPSAITQAPDSRMRSYPGLERRTELRERRPRALRRHTARVATRFAVLVVGDAIAIVLARALALSLAAETVWGAEAFAQSPLATGGRRLIFLAVATILAVFVNGGHSRHRALNQP